MITANTLVSREVIHCASTLVYTLASNNGLAETGDDMAALAEQATEAYRPTPDYEEAALQNGWTYDAKTECWVNADENLQDLSSETAEELCEANGIDATEYENEIFEHWIVTPWLADHLEARGERIVRDFADFAIWGRATTGQAIALDAVIEDITAALNRD